MVTCNPGQERSLRELKASTRQRFTGFAFGYPAAETEIRDLTNPSLIDSVPIPRCARPP